MGNYISVFSDWNTWIDFAKCNWDSTVAGIKSELDSCTIENNQDLMKGKNRLIFALRRAKNYDYDWAFKLCKEIICDNQTHSEALNLFIELLYKKNNFNEAIKYAEIYKAFLSPRTLIELYAKTENIQKIIDTIYSNKDEKRELIDTFFYTIDRDTQLAEKFANTIWKLRGCPACFLILKGVVISSHETNRFS